MPQARSRGESAVCPPFFRLGLCLFCFSVCSHFPIFPSASPRHPRPVCSAVLFHCLDSRSCRGCFVAVHCSAIFPEVSAAIYFLCLFFDTGSPYVVQADLNSLCRPRLAWNFLRSCLSFPSARIIGVCRHTQLYCHLFFFLTAVYS